MEMTNEDRLTELETKLVAMETRLSKIEEHGATQVSGDLETRIKAFLDKFEGT